MLPQVSKYLSFLQLGLRSKDSLKQLPLDALLHQRINQNKGVTAQENIGHGRESQKVGVGSPFPGFQGGTSPALQMSGSLETSKPSRRKLDLLQLFYFSLILTGSSNPGIPPGPSPRARLLATANVLPDPP